MRATARLDRLAGRMARGTFAGGRAQSEYEAREAARIDAMTDEQLAAHIDAHLQVLAILDDAGALDDVLSSRGLTRADLGLSV